MARRSKKHDGQLEFDLWGLSEQKATEHVEQARSAPPTPRECREIELPIHEGLLARRGRR